MFIVTGFPRSRTAWWSAYLTTGKYHCTHEAYATKPRDLSNSSQYDGDSDAAWLWMADKIPQHVKVLIIERGMSDALESVITASSISRAVWLPIMRILQRGMDMLTGDNVIRIPFKAGLDDIRRAHEFLMPDEPFDEHRARIMMELNIQHNYGRQ